MSYFISFLKQLNWIDLVVLILLFRILLISLKTGMGAEIFKVLGTLTAAYLSLHYYISISGYFSKRFDIDHVFVECFVFIVLAGLGYSFFLLLRLLLKRFINMEVVPTISRWGGLILGIFRAFLLGSLILYFFLATDNPYLRKSMKTSFSGMGLVYLAPMFYSSSWNGVISKLAVHEKFNSAVFEIEKDNSKKKK
jgi:uncharacterized membrane protein required for colicin V production